MKIQCDACHKEVASLFCPADEAALCHACDRTIHHANKLAGKHKRFSLHHPTSKDSPLCDICLERWAYVFCKEDRAILCRECDLSVHGVNEHTKKHNRFLLTGVKVGASSTSSNPTSFSSIESSLSNEKVSSCRMGNCDTGSVSTSSISQYLTETIPGYCMEDLLDASFPSNAFSTDYEQQSTFENQDVPVSMCSFPEQAWVPQSQARSLQFSTSSNIPQIDSLVGAMEMPKAKAAEGYSNWRYNNNNSYTAYEVPSINPPPLIKQCRRSR